MLYKSLVSFIVAFTVAAGVASATPVARTDGSECNTGTQSCCNTVSDASDPIVAALQGLVGIAIPVDLAVPVGISCLNALGTSSCTAQPVCCENVSQNGLINVGCTPINLGLRK